MLVLISGTYTSFISNYLFFSIYNKEQFGFSIKIVTVKLMYKESVESVACVK